MARWWLGRLTARRWLGRLMARWRLDRLMARWRPGRLMARWRPGRFPPLVLGLVLARLGEQALSRRPSLCRPISWPLAGLFLVSVVARVQSHQQQIVKLNLAAWVDQAVEGF
jgi:hypothetical protein